MFNIMWNGEVVDTAEDEDTANYLVTEYRIAFHSSTVTWVKV